MLPVFARITELNFAESLGISLLGILIVFFVLVTLMGMIRLMRFALQLIEGRKAVPVDAPAPVKAEPIAVTAARPAGMVPAKGSLGEVKLYSVADKTAAMIMAIVADKLDAPLNELRFISIKEKGK